MNSGMEKYTHQKRKNNYAVLEFPPENNKWKTVEVVGIEWVMEHCKTVLCPQIKNWNLELKSGDTPQQDWKKYNCRILKTGFDDLKSANLECQYRLNGLTSTYSDSSESDENRSNYFTGTANYDTEFNCLSKPTDDFDNQIINNDKLETIDEEASICINGSKALNGSTEKATNSTIELTTVEAIVIEQADYNSNYKSISAQSSSNISSKNVDSIQNYLVSSFELLRVIKTINETKSDIAITADKINTIIAQNEKLINIVAESGRTTARNPPVEVVQGINNKEKLNEFQAKLNAVDFLNDMVFEYTQFAYKGDAKKEVNGSVKLILMKLLDEKFVIQIKWDRLIKKELVTQNDDKIFFKRYSKILQFITDVCNKTKKDKSLFYNYDNIFSWCSRFF